MRKTVVGLIAAGVAGALALTGCSGETTYDSVVDKAKEEGELTIGVKYDQPALGLKKGDTVEGFDVDVAKYVANELGVDEENVEFREVTSDNREPAIERGDVDLVFATYSILPERKAIVTFGGPYYVAHQDIMVRADDNSINAPEDLEGKLICQASGSNSPDRIIADPPEGEGIAAETAPAGSYSQCMSKLKGGSLDAVTTDNLILAGFAAADPQSFRIVGQEFTDERYGVGMKKGDTKTCEAVNAALEKMWADGTAEKLFDKWFGETNLEFDSEQPTWEGCK